MFARSYTGQAGRRQSPVGGAVVVFVAGLALAGCAQTGIFEAASDAPAGARQTALVSARVSDGVDPSDWQFVREALSAIPGDAVAGTERNWQNIRTGSDGNVVALTVAAKKGGLLCRSFATTVNDTHGIRRYRGQSCLGVDGAWNMSGIVADDGASL
jgi:surface antigen